jgi:hypothetical protein
MSGLLIAASMMNPRGFPKLIGPYLGQKPPGTTPEVFAPGIVSREGQQSKLWITADGREVIFSSMDAPAGGATGPTARQIRFMRIRMKEGVWQEPDVLPFSRDFVNEEPCLSPDGQRLYFVSNRPKQRGGQPEKMPDIWAVERQGESWSEPFNLGEPVNSNGVEVQPHCASDGKLYFCRLDGIYCSACEAGNFQAPAKLDENIFPGRWSGICLSPDGRALLLHAIREDGLGGWDLYVSFRDAAGGWSRPQNLGGPVNSPSAEGNATFSPDGKYLFFTRDGDIYWVSARIIGTMRSR